MTTKNQGKKSHNSNKIKGKTFPRYEMEVSLEVAQVVYDKAGGACNTNQLAALLKYKSANNGAYLARVNAAKMFGFIDSDRGSGQYEATNRAISIFAQVTEEDRKEALVEAFLAVPVFNDMFQKLKDKPLPEEAGLKNLLKTHYNVPEGRISLALRILRESARFAGFFELHENRLIEPITNAGVAQVAPPEPTAEQEGPQGNQNTNVNLGSGATNFTLQPGNIHYAIMGLLQELPPAGEQWEKTQKDRFMAAFKSTIDFIYPEEKEVDL